MALSVKELEQILFENEINGNTIIISEYLYENSRVNIHKFKEKYPDIKIRINSLDGKEIINNA